MQRSILQPIDRWQRPDETCRMLATTDLSAGSLWSCSAARKTPPRTKHLCASLST